MSKECQDLVRAQAIGALISKFERLIIQKKAEPVIDNFDE